MQTSETLAQLICRTVLEFEKRQASLQQDKLRDNTSEMAIINTSNQNISKKITA